MAIRYDRIDAPDWMTEPFTQTPEGFLKGVASVTNIGVFRYIKADSSVMYELRHPDDVFNEESLNSLKMKPVTNDHPPVVITAENIKDYQVGNTGNYVAGGDNIHLTADLVIQDKNAVMDVMGGKRELSCGYNCDVIEESGTWLGVDYTHRQKNIRYNHVALVDRARAGEAARIRLDSEDAIMDIDTTASAVDTKNKEETQVANLRTIQIDSVDYEADENVIKALKAAEAKVDSLGADVKKAQEKATSVEAEKDALQAKLDSAEKKVKELEEAKVDEAQINELVNARVALLNSAKEAGVEVKADMSEMDVQKAVINKVYPDTKLDDKSEAYIMARFDCAMEDLPKEKDADASVRQANADTAPVEKQDSADDARKAMIDRLVKQGRE